MQSQDYFNLVSHNVYEDINYLQLGLQLAEEEFKQNSNLVNNTHRKLFLTKSISNHYYLFNACLENGLLKDIFSLQKFLKYIKRTFKTYSSFINHESNIRKQIFAKIYNSCSYIWPDEFLTIGLYKENSLDKITMYDYCVFVLNNTYRTIKDIKNLFPDVYNYVLSLYPIPNDDDFEQPPLSGYIYMFNHHLEDYPRTLITNKYAKYNKHLQQFYVFDDFEQSTKSKIGIEYNNKRRIQSTLEHFGKKWPMQVEEVKEKRKQTFLEKYGCEYISQNEEIKEKIKQTNLDRYGAENPMQNEDIKEKAKQTNLERYGAENPMQNENIREKAKETIFERYGVEYASQSEDIKEKTKQTNLERYGVEYASQTDEFKEKVRQTNLDRYGAESPMQNEDIKEKAKQTNIERYGCEYVSQNEDIKEKVRQTNLERYGVENYFQTEEYKQKYKEIMLERYGVDSPLKSQEIKNKLQQTNIERYGGINSMCSPDIVNKMIETKRKNKSFNTSKPEEIIYEQLCLKFGSIHIIRQYREDRYQFSCDFYIDIFDLFIEFQGTWFHGRHPFNDSSEEDNIKLSKMKNKINDGHISYKHAIYIWTESDPLKRQTAKNNNLNFVELWTLKEAQEFIDDLPWLTSI